MSNLPSWPAASEVYSKAYRVLERMARCGHVSRGLFDRRNREYHQRVSVAMKRLIDALNAGDEEQIKGLLHMTHIYLAT